MEFKFNEIVWPSGIECCCVVGGQKFDTYAWFKYTVFEISAPVGNKSH